MGKAMVLVFGWVFVFYIVCTLMVAMGLAYLIPIPIILMLIITFYTNWGDGTLNVRQAWLNRQADRIYHRSALKFYLLPGPPPKVTSERLDRMFERQSDTTAANFVVARPETSHETLMKVLKWNYENYKWDGTVRDAISHKNFRAEAICDAVEQFDLLATTGCTQEYFIEAVAMKENVPFDIYWELLKKVDLGEYSWRFLYSGIFGKDGKGPVNPEFAAVVLAFPKFNFKKLELLQDKEYKTFVFNRLAELYNTETHHQHLEELLRGQDEFHEYRKKKLANDLGISLDNIPGHYWAEL